MSSLGSSKRVDELPEPIDWRGLSRALAWPCLMRVSHIINVQCLFIAQP